MSVTIDSLDIQIRANAGSAAANIDRLAASLERLKSSAGLTKVRNNLSKLSAALNSLNGSAAALSNLEKLGNAMNSLSGIQKLSGLSSALTTLKRLPEIMKSIDPAAVKAFAQSMKELADALEPLATRISAISAGFARLPANIRNAVSAANQMNTANGGSSGGLNSGSLNLSSYLDYSIRRRRCVRSCGRVIYGLRLEWHSVFSFDNPLPLCENSNIQSF